MNSIKNMKKIVNMLNVKLINSNIKLNNINYRSNKQIMMKIKNKNN